jgi:HSP20 family protein
MLTRWDPFAEMQSLRGAMDRLFNESFVRPSSFWGAGTSAAHFPFDVYESGDEVYVRAAIPAVDPSQLEITVNQGVLTLKGYRSLYSGDQEKQYTWHVRGIGEGNFQFTVSLPTVVNADQAEAGYDAGILTVRLPKAETVRSRRIAVKGAQTQDVLPAGTQ